MGPDSAETTEIRCGCVFAVLPKCLSQWITYVRTIDVFILIFCGDIIHIHVLWSGPMCAHAKLSILFMYCVAYLDQHNHVCVLYAVLSCV